MEKCINSLLPAGEEAEIILVNDGSTKDNTAEIANDFAKKYPTIIKAIHQENKGHGGAVNTALANASGLYFKVVDSDDWADADALDRVMETINSFEEEFPDAIIVNYVYEHVETNTTRPVRYEKQLPQNALFAFEQTKKFKTGQFLAMHSLIYKTQVLKDCNLVLPEHTFYVDNLFVYKPLPYVKKFYYVNADFYRYYIGRQDQSVNETIIMNRIEQHIRVTHCILESHNLNEIKKTSPKLYKYMLDFVAIMMTINSIYLIKRNTKEDFEKKKALWQRLKELDAKTHKKCKNRITGLLESNNKFVCSVCKKIYVIVRKIFKFN